MLVNVPAFATPRAQISVQRDFEYPFRVGSREKLQLGCFGADDGQSGSNLLTLAEIIFGFKSKQRFIEYCSIVIRGIIFVWKCR